MEGRYGILEEHDVVLLLGQVEYVEVVVILGLEEGSDQVAVIGLGFLVLRLRIARKALG